jgi:PhzF family phenazine biosynthesis protein
MKLKLYQIDAFTNKVFGGNPAAVCPLDSWLPDQLMQSIAIENNLSETAFFIPKEDGFHLRWFTPKTEVDLCGHATLASAYVLFNLLDYSAEKIRFQTREGDLFVERKVEELIMDFPTKTPVKCEMPDLLVKALGVEPLDLYTNEDYVALLSSEDEVKAVSPDFNTMREIDTRGIIITAPGDQVDFVSRFFAPRFGIDEDPVTGSAHCVLTPFWAERLGKNSLTAKQVSARVGDLKCVLEGERVKIIGTAVQYMQAEIEIDSATY